MGLPSTQITKIAVTAATPVAMIAAAALIWQSSNAAFSGTTRNSGNAWSTGQVALTDDDAGSARFQVENMLPEATETKCIKVTSNSSVPGVVKGYAVNPVTSAQGLQNHVKFTVEYGTGGGFGSCNDFVYEGTSIPAGTSLAVLSTFDSYDEAIGGWDVPAGTHSRTYRITWKFDTAGLTQAQIDQLQGAQTGIDFQWELQTA